MKLYELSSAYQQILELIEEGQELDDTLESLSDAIQVKAENIAKVITTLDAQSVVIKDEEKRLYERRKSMEAQVISLNGYLETELRKCGIDKVKGQLFTIAMQRNAPSVEILDEALIPSEFIKTITNTSVDKRLLLEALKENEIAGATLRQTESLRIR
jgi:hypothetical protein